MTDGVVLDFGTIAPIPRGRQSEFRDRQKRRGNGHTGAVDGPKGPES